MAYVPAVPVFASIVTALVPEPIRIPPAVNVVAPVPPSATAIAEARLETIPPVMFALNVAVLEAVKEPAARVFDVGSVVKSLNKKKFEPASLIRPAYF